MSGIQESRKMSERSENAAENIMGSIMDTIADNLPGKKSVRFDEGGSSISDQAQRLFGGGGGGGKRNLHHVLGGGKRTPLSPLPALVHFSE